MEIEEFVEEKEPLQSVLDKVNETQTLVSTESQEWVKEETLVVVIKVHSEDIASLADFDICGKKMFEWVLLATSPCQQQVLSSDEDLFTKLALLAKDFNYVAVFYSDTPLLKKSTFLEIMKYFSYRKMNFLPLKRGFVIKAEYLQNFDEPLASSPVEFGTEDFLIVKNSKDLSIVYKKLSDQIKEYHKSQGVILLGEDSIYIDADVQIESGVVIYSNNTIKGKTYIGKNVVLDSGNIIVDSIICDKAKVCKSYLNNAKVEEGKKVYFEKIVNSTF